jgi:hypothetical protein
MKLADRALFSRPDSLSKYGAQLLGGVLGRDDVRQLRDAIDQANFKTRVVTAPEILGDPLFIEKIFLNEAVIETLDRIFGGKPVLFPSFQLQRNSYTQANLSRVGSGLHIDSVEEVAKRYPYMGTRTPPWVNVGCFLQDHDNDGWGGGIAIIPGTHRLFQYAVKLPVLCRKVSSALVSVARRYYPDSLLRIVPTMPGDVVIFDGRLLHASVAGPKIVGLNKKSSGPYQTYVDVIPPDNRKYVFYWFAGKDHLKEAIFANNFRSRADKLDDAYYEGGGFNYKKIVQLSYPKDYPAAFCQRALELGLNVASAQP